MKLASHPAITIPHFSGKIYWHHHSSGFHT